MEAEQGPVQVLLTPEQYKGIDVFVGEQVADYKGIEPFAQTAPEAAYQAMRLYLRSFLLQAGVAVDPTTNIRLTRADDFPKAPKQYENLCDSIVETVLPAGEERRGFSVNEVTFTLPRGRRIDEAKPVVSQKPKFTAGV